MWEQWGKERPELKKQWNRACYERNKPVQRERALKWARNNRDKVFNASVLRNFGITADQYNVMFKVQTGLCVICGRLEKAFDRRVNRIRRLHVDHDHATGVIRGLLCTRCNVAIGLLDDDPERAEMVASYIRMHRDDTEIISSTPRRIRAGARGTADCIAKARAAGIEVIEAVDVLEPAAILGFNGQPEYVGYMKTVPAKADDDNAVS